MNRVYKNIFSVIAAAVFVAFQGVAFASQSWPDFSADVVQTMGGKTTQSKMYNSNEKIRMETMGQTMIIRQDLKVSWILMPDNLYMEQSLDASQDMSGGLSTEGEMERVSEGRETLDGQEVEKFRVTVNTNKGTMILYHWLRDDGLPVKVEAQDGSWSTLYQNLQKGPQPAEMFEVPQGFQKMDMGMNMNDMMAAMQNMQGEMEQ